MNKENILITGALGHIGSRLIRELPKREDVGMIRILDNLSTQRYCSLFNLPENVKFEFLEGDIRNPEILEEATKGIDTIIHLAAITDAPSTIKNPELTFEVNLQGTRNVIAAAKNNGVKKFIIPSTTSVYGESDGIVDESFLDYKPQTPYAEAKLQSEREVISEGKQGKLETLVVRWGTIFGTSIGVRFHTAVNKFCYQAALNIPITVSNQALKGGRRPYLGINDAINSILFVKEKGKSGELYNVVTENYKVLEVIDAIKQVIPNVKINLTESPILNQKFYETSKEKIRYLGFVTKDNLLDIVGETISLFKAIKNY
jgi:UDP-glucose 4-epimerase